jgi:hypothetical protein
MITEITAVDSDNRYKSQNAKNQMSVFENNQSNLMKNENG